MRKVRVLFSLAALLVALSVALRGDDTVTGGLEGTVLTSDRQPVGDAVVTASSDRLMGVLTTVTGSRGDYHFYRLPPGTYRLIAKSDAFGERALADVAVHLGKTTRAEDIVMPPLRATTEVGVEASPPLLDPTSTTVGANITNKEFELLPVGRSYQTIAALVPGVTLDMANYDPVRLRDTPSFLGSSAPENAYIVDGLPTTDALWGLNGTQLTFSFIDELEVLTAGYQAEYGHSTGGIIKVITKSGGNDFHGDLYSYFNTWGMNGSGLWKSTRGTDIDWIGNQYADFGASLGGALLKDALWFFAAYNPATDESKSYGYFGQEMKGTQRSDIYAAKMTWNIDSKNRIMLSLFGDPKRYEGPWPQSSGNGSPASYEIAEERGANNAVLKYSGVTPGGNLILDFTAGRQAGRMHLDPLNGDTATPRSVYGWADPAAHGDPNPLHTNGYEDGAPPYWLRYDPVRSSAELDSTYLAGSHEIKGGCRTSESVTPHSRPCPLTSGNSSSTTICRSSGSTRSATPRRPTRRSSSRIPGRPRPGSRFTRACVTSSRGWRA